MLKTATYYKIQDVISAAANHTGGVKELAESMYDSSKSFVYYKRDAAGHVNEHPCSTATIRKSIRFCINLGLLVSEENCSLTDKGKLARNKSRFDLQIQQAVLAYLEKNSLPWNRIEAAINNTSLPFFLSLYQKLSPRIPEATFRSCLFLLAICGEKNGQNVLKNFQKKMYLTENRFNETLLQSGALS